MDRAKLIDTLYSVNWISSGSTLLDLALGGGWGGGRIFNVVGDRSSGKTLLVIEALANFTRTYPKGKMLYIEAESAFDEEYAATLGFPSSVERPLEPVQTVEEFFNVLDKFCTLEKGEDKSIPRIAILDSLDALSDNSEMESDFENKSTYGTGKAKQMSKLFRMLVQKIADCNCTLGVISQVRDNIGVTYGDGNTRSGGRALDFYCSQILWLNEVEKLKRTIKEQDKVYGIEVRGKVKKNKVGLPFRDAQFPIIFGYGIDDEISMVNWLKTIKAFSKEEAAEKEKEIKKAREAQDYPKLAELRQPLVDRVKVEWEMMENILSPKIRKYSQVVV